MTIRPATRLAMSAATNPTSHRIENLHRTVASEGVELTVVLTNSPGARRDAGPALHLRRCTATRVSPPAATSPGREAHRRVHRPRVDERVLQQRAHQQQR